MERSIDELIELLNDKDEVLKELPAKEEGTLFDAKPATAFDESKGEDRIAGQAAGLLNRIQEKELEELLKEFLTS